MERSELKELLKEMGVKHELTEMPAIIEPLYKMCFDKSVTEIKKTNLISTKPDGTFKYGNSEISFSTDNKELITSGGIHINEFGIEVSSSKYYDFFSEHLSRKPDGKIERYTGNDNTCETTTTINFDNGSWSISDASGENFSYHSSREEKSVKNLPYDTQSILEEFDENSQEVMKNYPKTIPWYEERRKELVSTLELEEQTLVKQLQEKIIELEKLNAELKEQNEGLRKMLSKSLNFADSVKKHPVGKVMFGSDLKEFQKLDSEKEALTK